MGRTDEKTLHLVSLTAKSPVRLPSGTIVKFTRHSAYRRAVKAANEALARKGICHPGNAS